MILRAGDLDRTIAIVRAGAPTISASRVATVTWAPIMTLRAKLVEASALDVLRNGGAFAAGTCVFLTRWVDGLLTSDRVAYLDTTYAIKGFTEIGRRVGLQLRCEALQTEIEQ